MKRSNTWIVVGILLSGAVALFAKSAGASTPFSLTTVPGQTYRFTWTFSRPLSATEQQGFQIGLGAAAKHIVISPQSVSYDQVAAVPVTLTPGKTGNTIAGVTMVLSSVTVGGAS